MFSTLGVSVHGGYYEYIGVIMSTSGVFSTSGRYHEYIGGEGVQYIGGYHEYIMGIS